MDAGLADLIKSTQKGILVTRLWYIRSVDPQTLLYTGLTRDGTFYIENGAIKHPVKNFRFNESPIIMFEQSRNTGQTGKGQWKFDSLYESKGLYLYQFIGCRINFADIERTGCFDSSRQPVFGFERIYVNKKIKSCVLSSAFFFTRLQYESGDWDVDQRMPSNLLNSLVEYTTLDVDKQENIITLGGDDIF